MESNNYSISSLSEKALIERIIKLSKGRKSTLKGEYFNLIGDDCSVIRFEDKYLISTSDMLIESHHFPEEMSFFDRGFKAVTVNVSDLASMGAKPLGILISIGLYKDLKLSEFDEIFEGILSACDFYNIALLGGDTNDADEIIITGTAFGYTEKEPMMKYGLNIGDLVCLTGNIGFAALGFELLNRDEYKIYNQSIQANQSNQVNQGQSYQNNCDIVEYSISMALKPIAKIYEGQILLDSNVKVATDITDGLGSELESLLESDKKYYFANNQTDESSYNKGIRIYEEKLDISKDYLEISDNLDLDTLELKLNIGEDFELLFIIPFELKDSLNKLLDFKVIGEVIDKNTLEIVLSDGDIVNLSTKGYDHFKS
ncbi:thiamine-phosphate kinase [uncultured Methanobrevibacter sp.]|uniref:thiamine-phosphate kinase n=1 Tax=uncultured Methanobrevibacter sp. TaxID=253161 RepID=UPI0025D9F1CC|nr:thiamine-phosphate kinase [uncultured Methanobrevibacter sp.]